MISPALKYIWGLLKMTKWRLSMLTMYVVWSKGLDEVLSLVCLTEIGFPDEASPAGWATMV